MPWVLIAQAAMPEGPPAQARLRYIELAIPYIEMTEANPSMPEETAGGAGIGGV